MSLFIPSDPNKVPSIWGVTIRKEKFAIARLSECVVVWAEYFEGKAQINVTVSNKPGTDRENPVTLFVGTYDGEDFDLTSDEAKEYEAYEGWPGFTELVRRDFVAADVMLA